PDVPDWHRPESTSDRSGPRFDIHVHVGDRDAIDRDPAELDGRTVQEILIGEVDVFDSDVRLHGESGVRMQEKTSRSRSKSKSRKRIKSKSRSKITSPSRRRIQS